ncbi:MAG TPA: KpsF/GutQ family sugar-phosphate isomerase [Kiloniellales bacterium]|nr:KpsF/GutQ family sugar-phosphate isomerase [Kiloniellales bacterium]
MSSVKMAVEAAEQQVSAEQADLASARRTLRAEAQGLEALAASLGDAFIKAVDQLEATSGRVIVTGMGKSGHVGCKMAATLASTGTPAQFVHPAEASHGDLGMITRKDAIIALSNSGNTPELASVIAYSRRFDIPLLAITGKRRSILAEACDTLLLLPDAQEACPMGLAPTTSTTMTLALGDALAVALLERRGFTAEDFKVFHPGGALGKRLVRVADVMHGPGEMPLCRPETPMSEAILLMTAKTFGVVGVLDENEKLGGIITDGDLRRHMGDDLLAQAAGDVMTSSPITIQPLALGAEALKIMNAKRVTCLFVEEEGRPVGLVRLHDLLREGVA